MQGTTIQNFHIQDVSGGICFTSGEHSLGEITLT